MKFNFFDAFPEDLALGRARLGDGELAVYLTNDEPDPLDRTTADLPEIAVRDGYNGPIGIETSVEREGKVVRVRWPGSLSVSSTGSIGPFRHPVLASGEILVGWWQGGEEVVLLNNETWVLEVGETLLEMGA